MTHINFENLFKSFIGYDDLRRDLIFASKNASSNLYPPCNIEQLDDNTFIITLAVAGYQIEDLDISLDDDKLKIKGSKKEDEDKKYLFKGISAKSFERVYQLGKHIEVAKASLEHGMLSIKLERNIPEEDMPKKIEIN